MKKVVQILGAALLLISAGFTPAQAAATPAAMPITLGWDTTAGVAGYALYYANLTSGGAPVRVDVGSVPVATIQLLVNSTYYLYVVTYNSAGVESPRSNLIYYTPPAISRLKLNRLTNGSMRIDFRAVPGQLCRIEYTSQLKNPQWQALGNVTPDANGNATINDPLTSRPPIRFYRAVQP